MQKSVEEIDKRVDWWAVRFMIGAHVAAVAGIIKLGLDWWMGASVWFSFVVMVVTFSVRTLSISDSFHRYFWHQSYAFNQRFLRPLQFAFAFVGTTAAQRGPVWWAYMHGLHHANSDREGDVHSPVISGFWYAHIGWIFMLRNKQIDWQSMRRWAKFPELVWLEKYYVLPPIMLATTCFLLGGLQAQERFFSGAFTTVLVGFFLSTVILYHLTYAVNSLGHLRGYRRYPTKDHSCNRLVLAFLTAGEFLHNNHHHCPGSASFGVTWYEKIADWGYLGLWLLWRIGVITHLKVASQDAAAT